MQQRKWQHPWEEKAGGTVRGAEPFAGSFTWFVRSEAGFLLLCRHPLPLFVSFAPPPPPLPSRPNPPHASPFPLPRLPLWQRAASFASTTPLARAHHPHSPYHHQQQPSPCPAEHRNLSACRRPLSCRIPRGRSREARPTLRFFVPPCFFVAGTEDVPRMRNYKADSRVKWPTLVTQFISNNGNNFLVGTNRWCNSSLSIKLNINI